jgi:integrase
MPISPKFIVSPGFPWFPVVSRDISCPCLPGAYPREQLTMRHRLTAAFVTKAAPVADKDRTVFWDTTQPGFGLMVTRNGARSYVVQYRAHGRSRRLTLDASALSLDAAKREARKHLGEVAKGGDPLTERRRESAAASDTLRAVAEAYFRREGKKIRTMDERRRTLERLVFPALGPRPIDDIGRSDIVRLLDKIEDNSGPVMADRTLAYLRKVLNWHATRSDTFRTPIVRGMARTKSAERARDRILSDDEIRRIWQATKVPGPFSSLVQFLLLSACRRGEALYMTRSELNGRDWLIPAARHKSKREFLLPLSKAAVGVLAAMPVIGPADGYLFTLNGTTPIGAESKAKARLDKASGVSGWTLHDCRRTARSLMSRAGVPSDHAERAIGHVIPGIRQVYDRHSFRQEKQAALEALAKEIAAIVGRKAVAL